MSFTDAIEAVIDGKRITRDEWGDNRHYGVISEQLLHLHKAGESENTLHPWIISEGDLLADDWRVL